MSELYRYPVKSMLGERRDELELDGLGVVGDRAQALIDVETGNVATAKQPRWWRALLRCRAATERDGVRVTLPDGSAVGSLAADDALSALLGRPVRMEQRRADGASVERPDPDQVLEHGLDAELDTPALELAMGTPGGRFVDYAPLHVVTTASLERVGVDVLRYRPNIVIATPPGTPAFVENDWIGGQITIGDVRLEAMLPTPRCSVPTLEHGDLPRSPEALRTPARQNKVWVDLLDNHAACLGLYARVVQPGTIRAGDPVRVPTG